MHKGLDLVLEAFAGMPDHHLYVCGPLQQEKDFVKAFYTELYETPNIHAVGWVDLEGPEFLEIVNKCVGLATLLVRRSEEEARLLVCMQG